MNNKKKYLNEHMLQADCVQWFWNTYPEHRRMLHANDNNSYNRIEGNKKKALGVVPGVSDLELIVNNGVTIYIELKLPGKKQTIEQIDFENKLRERGHIYFLIEYFEDFQQIVKNYL